MRRNVTGSRCGCASAGEEVDLAASSLGVSPDEIEEFVTRAGRPAGPPWTEEHRRAYAAGIAALAPHARMRLRRRLIIARDGGNT